MLAADEKLITRVTESDVSVRIQSLAQDVASDYADLNLLLLGLLNGGAPTTVWLGAALYKYGLSARMDFMRVESYGISRESNGQPEITAKPKLSLLGYDVLLVDDIGDTFHTLHIAWDWVLTQQPHSLAALALAKKIGTQETNVPIRYLGFELPAEYYVGSGLDASEEHRFFPGIGAIVRES